MAISLYASLLNGISLSLFVYAAGPVSGGHLNPCITMATFVAGLSTLARSVIYIIAQCVGAIIGSYWLKLGLGDDFFRAVRYRGSPPTELLLISQRESSQVVRLTPCKFLLEDTS